MPGTDLRPPRLRYTGVGVVSFHGPGAQELAGGEGESRARALTLGFQVLMLGWWKVVCWVARGGATRGGGMMTGGRT